LDAKDKEYAEIFEKEQQNSTSDTSVEKEKIIESLNIQIAKNEEEMAKLRESNSESEDEDDGTTTESSIKQVSCLCTHI
jgi:predicted HTH transcriptional regulator